MRLLLLLLGVQAGLGYHVLFYHTLGTRSHLLQYKPLVAELLTRGHKVGSVNLVSHSETQYMGLSVCSSHHF